MDGEIGEERLGLLVGDGRVHDHVVALLPVDRRGDAVLVANLESCSSGTNQVSRNHCG